jgi:hypothetical protein
MAYPSHFLSMDLPKAFGLVPSGRHQPCLHGCVLHVKQNHVSLSGPSRDSVIEQALRFVRVHARGGMRTKPIAAVIYGPLGKDRGWITVEAKVLWSWGGIEPVSERAGDAA